MELIFMHYFGTDWFGPERIHLRNGMERFGAERIHLRNGTERTRRVPRSCLQGGTERNRTDCLAERNGTDYVERIFVWNGMERTFWNGYLFGTDRTGTDHP